MSISMYQVSLPVFTRALRNLRHVLEKGEAHAKAKRVTDAVLLQTRLIPDMFPLVKQVQIACDQAARGSARLAGVEPKSFPDTEATMADVYARIDAAVAYIENFKPEQVNGAEDRTIAYAHGHGELRMQGMDFVNQYVLPNLYFHCTTAYDLLRGWGVEIGKADFLGKI